MDEKNLRIDQSKKLHELEHKVIKERRALIEAKGSIEEINVYISIDGHHFFHNTKKDIEHHINFFRNINEQYDNFLGSLEPISSENDAFDYEALNRLEGKLRPEHFKVPKIRRYKTYIDTFVHFLKEDIVENEKTKTKDIKNTIFPYDLNYAVNNIRGIANNFSTHPRRLFVGGPKLDELYNLYKGMNNLHAVAISRNVFEKNLQDFNFCTELLDQLKTINLDNFDGKIIKKFNYTFSIHAAKPDYEELAKKFKYKKMEEINRPIQDWCDKNIKLINENKMQLNFYENSLIDFKETEDFYNLWKDHYDAEIKFGEYRINMKKIAEIEECEVDINMGIESFKYVLANKVDKICLITNDRDHKSTINHLKDLNVSQIYTCHLDRERYKAAKLKVDGTEYFYPKKKMNLDLFSWICFDDWVDIPSYERVESMINEYNQEIINMLKNIEISKNRLDQFKEILDQLKQDRF